MRILYRVRPAATQNLGFCKLIHRTTSFIPLYTTQARVTEDGLPGFSRDEGFFLLQGLVGVIKLFLLVVVVLLVNLALLVGLCYCFSCSNGVVCVIDGGFVIGDDKYYWWWQCYW